MTAVVVGALRFVEGRRLRDVAEDAVLFGVGALIVGAPPLLAWAILAADRSSPSLPAESAS
jgi:hypothetical protein